MSEYLAESSLDKRELKGRRREGQGEKTALNSRSWEFRIPATHAVTTLLLFAGCRKRESF